MKKYLIFDFDGTIADTLPASAQILNDLSTKYGYKKQTDEEMLIMRDYSIPEIFKQYHVSTFKLPFMVRDVKHQLEEKVHEIGLIKGMKEVLHSLKDNGYHIEIVTSNKENNVTIILQNNGIDIFDHVQSGVTVFGKDKVIKRLLKRRKIPIQECIYIGDEVRDVEAAKKISLPVIAVTWGFNSRQRLQKASPDFIIDTSQELLTLLKVM